MVGTECLGSSGHKGSMDTGQGGQTKQGHGQGHRAGASVLATTKGWQLPAVKQSVQSIPGGHSLEWTASEGPCKAF